MGYAPERGYMGSILHHQKSVVASLTQLANIEKSQRPNLCWDHRTVTLLRIRARQQNAFVNGGDLGFSTKRHGDVQFITNDLKRFRDTWLPHRA
jgi:hypothetical protein